MERFHSYSRYLEDRYGAKTYRVSVDAGFSCPNRGLDRGRPGCAFCDVVGSRSPYLGTHETLEDQIRRGLGFLRRRYKAENFLLYFQAYSNTNAPADELRRIYDTGLSLGRFRELIVSTRPDCIDKEKAGLLAEYRTADRDVWVELGLQSARESTLERIERGHGVKDFERAFSLLRERGLKISVHLIFGLPGEDRRDVLYTADYVGRLRPEGVKIHNLHVPKSAPLYRDLLDGELVLPCAETYLEYVTLALELLPKDTVIMRTTCDTPRDRLAFPRTFPDKSRFLELLRGRLLERDTYQGRLFSEASSSAVRKISE